MQKSNPFALLPLAVFLLLYLGGSWYLGDFYSLPVFLIFMLALGVAFIQYPKIPLSNKIHAFAKGAGDDTLLSMILIFLLAGAFGAISKEIGAVDSVVKIALNFIPGSFLIAGFFIIASIISISMGTSVGTIAVITPLAIGMQSYIGEAFSMLLAAIIGGAMLGDNLSFISDTTIAATRTQGISMKEKFVVNVRIVTLPACVTLILYFFHPVHVSDFSLVAFDSMDFIKITPYLVVFILAILGVNVLISLGIAILLALTIGWSMKIMGGLQALEVLQNGLASMFELSMLCIIIAGTVGIIRENGGIQYLLSMISNRIQSSKQAEIGIAVVTGLVNACVANNTIAILIVGPMAKEISKTNNVLPKRTASIMDTISCFVQGCLPYGAQILTVLSLIGYNLSAFEIIQFLYYPFLIGLGTLLFILFFPPKIS